MTGNGSQSERPSAIQRGARAAISTLLALSIVLLSPGLKPYQAFAAEIEGGVPEGVPAVSAGPSATVPQIPSVNVDVPAVGVPEAALPALTGADKTLTGSSFVSEGQAPAALPAAVANGVPAAAAAAASTKLSPLAAIRAAVGKLAKGTSESGKQAELNKLYGEKAAASPEGGAPVDGSNGTGLTPSGLTQLSVSDLETIASDKSKTFEERLAAVKQLQKQDDAPAMAALERLGAYDKDASAQDYEVKRQALRALADLGKVVSLPAVSEKHAQEILQNLKTRPIDFAAFDYDDTIEPRSKPITKETSAALADLGRAGVPAMILTDRSPESRGAGDTGIFESVKDIDAKDARFITLGSNRGAQTWTFDKAAKPVLLSQEDAWNDNELAVLDFVKGALASRGYADGRDLQTAYDFAIYLKPELSEQEAVDAYNQLRGMVQRQGWSVILREPHDGSARFLTVTKYDKSLGVSVLRKDSGRIDKRRLIERAVPGALRGLADKLAALIPSRTLSGQGLVVGDHMFGTNAADADMVKAAPGGIGISVGGTADPRLDNVFVWPTEGHQASVELAKAAAQGAQAGEPAPKPDDPVNNKTLVALILQRLPSMAAYMLVTIAFVGIAVPIVGWTGYGILMSLSPMAGIAAAKIMAGAIKNMDARGAMSLNTVLRVGSLMALPAFHFFGILNVGTLVLGALAEGFLLSSIMTTEGSFLKVLFPAKQLGNINGALFMMFPGVQVVLGLFLHFGKVADVISPFTIFAGAAMVNLVMVLPLILWGIPRIKLSANGVSAMKTAPRRTLLENARKSWKTLALFAAGVGTFAGLTFGMPYLAAFGAQMHWAWPGAIASFIKAHQGLTAPVPILGALVYWIVKSDAFKALRSGATAQASPAEKALRQERAAAQARGASAEELGKLDAQLKTYDGRQLRSILLMAGSTLLYYPLYLVAAPHVAEMLVGAANKGQMIGQFLGSLFFGGLISTAARTKLPEVGLTIAGKRRAIGVHRIVQAAIAGLAGLWAMSLFPGLLAFPAGALAAVALIAASGRITDRGWVQLLGVGASMIWLPFVVWTWPALLPFLSVKTAMYLALLSVGLFNGPSFVSLISYMMRNTLPAESSNVQGIQGSLFNAAISGGYALLTIVSGFINPAYPAVLGLLGVVSAALGILFWRAPKGLPGLSTRLIEPRRKAPPTTTGGQK